MHRPSAAKTRYTAEDDHAVNAMLVLQNIENFFHKRFMAAMIRFPQVYANDHDLVFHIEAP
jgi:hypothetical protein